jgi:hypothetical protein
MKTSRATSERQADSVENSNIQPKKKTKHTCRTPTVQMEGSAYSLRGRNRPRMAYSMMMMMMKNSFSTTTYCFGLVRTYVTYFPNYRAKR